MKVSVSVIITTYNRSQLLKELSLPSVLNQIYKDFECIVVDDYSTDDTEKVVGVIQERDSRVRYVKLDRNRGIGGARNVGIKESRGDFIVFLDDDDAFKSVFLKKTIERIVGLSKEFGAVGVGRVLVTEDYKYYRVPSLALKNSFYTAIDDGWLLRREVFNQISYDENLSSDEDADFGVQFFQKYKADFIDEPLMIKNNLKKRTKSFYLSPSVPSKHRLRSLERFFNKNISIFKRLGTRHDLEFIYRFTGRNFCWAGKMKEGIPLLWKACLTRPNPRNILNFLFALLGHKAYIFYWKLEMRIVHFLKAHFISPLKKV